MEAASNRSIPLMITERRPGDAAISVADPRQALLRLDWRPSAVLKRSAVTAGLGSRPIQTDTPDTGHKLSVTSEQNHAAVLGLDSRL